MLPHYSLLLLLLLHIHLIHPHPHTLLLLLRLLLTSHPLNHNNALLNPITLPVPLLSHLPLPPPLLPTLELALLPNKHTARMPDIQDHESDEHGRRVEDVRVPLVAAEFVRESRAGPG